MDEAASRRGLNEAQRRRSENVGILAASGMIAGEALAGLVTATFAWQDWKQPLIFEDPSYLAGLIVVAIIGYILIAVPLKNAGSPDEPAPPAAIM
jgi:MFS family permease